MLESSWSWEVGVDADGVWDETFTDKIEVGHVKLFVEDEDGKRTYVRADQIEDIEVDGFECDAVPEPKTGHALIEMKGCENGQLKGLPTTPTWRDGKVGTPLHWRVDFLVTTPDVFVEDLPVRPGDRAFIEFHLAGEPQGEPITPTNPLIPPYAPDPQQPDGFSGSSLEVEKALLGESTTLATELQAIFE